MSLLRGTALIPMSDRGFYGWRMVAFASVALAMTGPGQTVGVSVFVNPMVEDLGISRTQLSTAYLIGTLTGAIALPWIGQALDRYGVRRVMAVIGALFGAVLIFLSTVTTMVGLTAGFVGIRMMGQGALSLTATTAVALWFARRRGTAMGIVSAAGGVLMTTVPLVGEMLIGAHGWRTAWVIEGVAVWIIVIPMALIAVRNRPSDIGQHVDGIEPADHHADVPWGVGRRVAMRTAFFWVITGAVATSAALATAVAFHQIDLLSSRGLTPAQAAANFIPQMIATLAVAIGIGALADRVSPKGLIAASMATLSVGLIAATVAAPGLTAIGYGLLIGASAGAIRVVEAAELPRYFGTTHVGAIRGLVTAFAVAASALGPVLFAVGHDITGDYTVVLLVGAVIPLISCVAALLVRLPLYEHSDAVEFPAHRH